MLPQYHFSLGLVASLFLYFGFDIQLLGCFIFLIATVGIDVDHYLYYFYRKGDWNLFNATRWFMKKWGVLKRIDIKIRREFYTGFCFLHGIEVLALTALLGYFAWDLFYFVALGFLFHLILDHIDQAFWRGRFDKFSIVYDYFKYGDLKFVDELESLAKLKSKKDDK
jgi:hypothetical protein